MKKVSQAVAMVGLLSSMSVVNASYVDITIADPHANKTFTPGTTGASGPINPALPEDNETEYNATSNQSWDLEAFSFDADDGLLSMKGGFNFLTGKGFTRDGNTSSSYSSGTFQMGDIFVYINTGVPYTAPSPTDHNGPWTGKHDWDYVIAFERDSNGNIKKGSGGSIKYAIKLNGDIGDSGDADLTPDGSSYLNEGLPWKWDGKVSGSGLPTATYSTYNNQSQSTSNSDLWWNTISGIDISSILNPGDEIYFHTTMECGNDVLWGRTTIAAVPDAGATIGLLGLGLAGLVALRRREA